eukprot:CAMPEP_0179122940 /NCGR_PEP_ID=MMETSP0796-20121207/58041_1 /TAXON_ID=73915 /ORGANISM="Pyrodinium bahamense, Strain pbaha01" /LENGTH=133 /DNA_ID=CAMNT_0020821571 /DNA_START=109 /DNA_END=507 /DNA_ORIENTATION=-
MWRITSPRPRRLAWVTAARAGQKVRGVPGELGLLACGLRLQGRGPQGACVEEDSGAVEVRELQRQDLFEAQRLRVGLRAATAGGDAGATVDPPATPIRKGSTGRGAPLSKSVPHAQALAAPPGALPPLGLRAP